MSHARSALALATGAALLFLSLDKSLEENQPTQGEAPPI
jgi:hypothetical protein